MLVPVRNSSRNDKILCGENITLPAGKWTDVPDHVAYRFSKDRDLTFDWQVLYENALDWRDGVRHVSMIGPINPYEGYGLGTNTVISALAKAGIEVHLQGKRNAPFLDRIGNYPETREAINRSGEMTKWGIAHTWPPDFGVLNAARRIGWSMWEATVLPQSWLPHLKLVDRLIVPTKGQVEIFSKDFKKPIDVIPYAIDFTSWTPIEREDKDVFTFLCWGRLSARKCPIDLIDCFWHAFGGGNDPNRTPDVRLILKTRQGDLGTGKFRFRIDDDRVTVIDDEWPVEHMVQLAHSADCGVFLSHGEGFGLPAVQAMATGLPVILSNHSGQSEFANPKYNYPVRLADPPHVPSPLGFGVYDSLDWWENDYQHAVDLMRHVYEHRNEARAKGAKAAPWVRKKFSLEVMAKKLGDLITSLD